MWSTFKHESKAEDVQLLTALFDQRRGPQKAVNIDSLAQFVPACISAVADTITAETSPLALESLAADGFGGANAVGAYGRDSIPWNSIANWTHTLPQSPTGTWMDAYRGGQFHRWMRHNPVDFFRAWLDDTTGTLKISEYLKHIPLDVITTNGLPILPEAIHLKLIDLGVPKSVIFAWTHLNVFDFTVGALSTADGAHSLVLALMGHLPWEGMKSVIFTEGVGAVEIWTGIEFANPFLVSGGVMHCASGVISAWKHWHMPNQSAIEQLLPTLFHGLEGGLLSSGIRLALTWNCSNALQRLAAGTESAALSLSTAILGAAVAWLATPACIGYGFGKLAWKLSEEDSSIWRKTEVASPYVFTSAIESIFENGGHSAITAFQEYLMSYGRKSESLAPEYLGSECWGVPPKQAAHALAKEANWGVLPPDLAHVFSKRPLKTGV